MLFGAGQENVLRAAPDGPGLLPGLSPCRPGLDLCLAVLGQAAPARFCAVFPWWHVGVSPFGVGVSYCLAYLWPGGLRPAVGVEQSWPGRFPACFCSRDRSALSLPTCSRLCGAANPLRNGSVRPKLAWPGAWGLVGSAGAGAAESWSGPRARLVAWGPLVAGQPGLGLGASTPLSCRRVPLTVRGAVRAVRFVPAALEHQN